MMKSNTIKCAFILGCLLGSRAYSTDFNDSSSTDSIASETSNQKIEEALEGNFDAPEVSNR